MLDRNKNSHKGDNGRVMVIGGNELFHGAPVLCALAAEYSGVDLLFPWLPPCHAQVARTYSLNFIIQTFAETHLTPKDVDPILRFSETVDVVAIGPGLGSHKDTEKAVKTLLAKLQTPTVVDASALIATSSLPSVAVLTPHRGEFRELSGLEPTPENVQKFAQSVGAIVLCKGPEDIISDGTDTALNNTGNALMTVGGTGDALTGLVAGLMAQKMPAMEACRQAAHLLGKAAENISKAQASVRAHELIKMIPLMLMKE